MICVVFRNIPHIHVHEKQENKEKWHGAKIQIVIEGNWTTYRVCISFTLTFGFYWLDFEQSTLRMHPLLSYFSFLFFAK